MDQKHYTEEELKSFFEPTFGEEQPAVENQITEHLKTCEACAGLAMQAQEGAWKEIRTKFRGF